MSLRGNVPLVWVASNLILYHSCYWNYLQFTITNTSSTIDVPEFSFEASKGQFSLKSLQWITRFISNPIFKFEVVSHPRRHTTNAEYACNHVHMCMYMCTQCLHMHAHTSEQTEYFVDPSCTSNWENISCWQWQSTSKAIWQKQQLQIFTNIDLNVQVTLSKLFNLSEIQTPYMCRQ